MTYHHTAIELEIRTSEQLLATYQRGLDATRGLSRRYWQRKYDKEAAQLEEARRRLAALPRLLSDEEAAEAFRTGEVDLTRDPFGVG